MKTQNENDEVSLEEKFKRKLLELGFLTEIRPPLSPDKYPKNRKPIPLGNSPGSRLMIEDRR